jgi:hypothetical protein
VGQVQAVELAHVRERAVRDRVEFVAPG